MAFGKRYKHRTVEKIQLDKNQKNLEKLNERTLLSESRKNSTIGAVVI